MNRRNTKEELLELFYTLRGRIDGLVLRTSLITGLPFEDEAAFDELCRFLREVQIERAGVFPYSPEEGTRAALMENRVDTAEAERRAELVVDVQSRIMDDFNESRMGDVTEVLCEGWDAQAMSYAGRSWAESPDIDGRIYFTAQREVKDGEFVPVRITGTMDGELTGELWEE
jgi:ribosomal protein S12 methylthiotransferase